MERTPRSVTLIGAEQTVLCTTNLLSTPSPRLTPTGKISHAKTRVYTQRYRKEWELMQDFAGWLTSVPYQPTRAYCKYCKKNLHAHRLSLLKHTCTMKHQRAALTHELEQKKIKLNPNSTEIGLTEEVETMDDHQIEVVDENEEEIEYVVERLETDEEDDVESQVVKEEIGEIVDEEEREKEEEDSLCAQLQSSDDDNPKPVIKKIKLMPEQKCRDTLAEAMAHVHSEYLEEEEIVDQGNVQMEMVVESADADISILPDSPNNAKISEELSENQKTDMKSDNKSPGKILENKTDLIVTSSLPILNTTYQTIPPSSAPTQNMLNFVPIAPNIKAHKTITLMCGSKTFKLSGGTFQPGTQYVLTKLAGKPTTLMMADQKKTITVNEPDKVKIIESAVPSTSQPSTVPSTSQQQTVVTNEQSTAVGTKESSSKKTYSGKQSGKPASKKLRISTYVTDITKGVPIGGLQVSLYKLMEGKWTFLNESNTNSEGHCTDLVQKLGFTAGRYKIHFDVDKYFTLRRIETIFPFVEIVFDVRNANGHYHLPLLLGPFSYTIYRGT